MSTLRKSLSVIIFCDHLGYKELGGGRIYPEKVNLGLFHVASGHNSKCEKRKNHDIMIMASYMHMHTFYRLYSIIIIITLNADLLPILCSSLLWIHYLLRHWWAVEIQITFWIYFYNISIILTTLAMIPTHEWKLWTEVAKQVLKIIWRVILLAIYAYVLFINPQEVISALGRKFDNLYEANDTHENS